MRHYPTISEAAADHLDDMSDRGVMPATIANHKMALDHAIKMWGDIDVRNIREDNIDGYFKETTWAPGTQMVYLTGLRKFGDYLRRNDYWPRTFDPCDGWTIRYQPVRDRLWLTLDEMMDSIEIAGNPRNRAMIALAIYALPRASEIVSLTIGDVDLKRNYLNMYRHKNKQYDRMPISAELHAEMERWLGYYEQLEGPLDPTWLLTPSLKPHPMMGVPGQRMLVPTGEPQRMRVNRQVTNPHLIAKNILTDLGYRRVGNGMHVYRRSGARQLFERLRGQGYDHALRRVASMLGHKQTSITEHYIGVDAERQARDEMIAGKPMYAAA